MAQSVCTVCMWCKYEKVKCEAKRDTCYTTSSLYHKLSHIYPLSSDDITVCCWIHLIIRKAFHQATNIVLIPSLLRYK